MSAIRNFVQTQVTANRWAKNATKEDFDRVAGADGKVSGQEAAAELMRTTGREPTKTDKHLFNRVAGEDHMVDLEEAAAEQARRKLLAK
jgi:hypothetical protein